MKTKEAEILLSGIVTPDGQVNKRKPRQRKPFESMFRRLEAEKEVKLKKELEDAALAAKKAKLKQRMARVYESPVLYQTLHILITTCQSCKAEYRAPTGLTNTFKREENNTVYSKDTTYRDPDIPLQLGYETTTSTHCTKCIQGLARNWKQMTRQEDIPK